MVKNTALKKQTVIGVFWNFLEQILRKGVGIVTTLTLAWFLVPEDYGLIAMMAVFLAFSGLIMEGGFGQALIRKRDVTQLEYSTAFFSNIVLAIFSYGVLFFFAPLVADFYNEQVLVDLIRVSGLGIILGSLVIVQDAVLVRSLQFKVRLKVSLPAAIISGIIAIILANMGYGVWALVVQSLVSSLLSVFFYWRLKVWRPSLEFSWHALKELFGFGGYLLVAQMTGIPFKNMYVIVIAKFFSVSVAGYYFFAEKIKDLLISQLVETVQNVTYPALAKIQNEDIRLKQGYRKVISITTFLLFPFMALLAALAEPLFQVILSTDWYPAVPYLQLMCLAALLYPLHSINLNILKVKGRSDLVLYLGIFKKTVAIAIFYVTYQYGIMEILMGQIVSSVLAYIPNSYFSKKLIGYSITEQIIDFVPGLLLSLFVAGLALGGGYWFDFSSLVELLLFGFLGAIFYIAGAYLLKLDALNLVLEIVKEHRFKA